MSDRAAPTAGKTLAMMGGGARIQAIIPTTIGEAFALAEMVFAGGLAPEAVKKPQQLTIIFLKGMEIGLPPMAAMETIGVINGKACLHSDGIPSLLWAHGFKIRERYEHEDNLDQCIAHCEIIRPDGEKYTFRYSAQDAKDNGLWRTEPSKSPWWLYKKRMLRMRCRGWLARDCASDVLKGIPIYEEQADIELSKDEYSEVKAGKTLLDLPDKLDPQTADGSPIMGGMSATEIKSEAENNQDQPITNVDDYLKQLHENLAMASGNGDSPMFEEIWDGHTELFEAGRLSRTDHQRAEALHDVYFAQLNATLERRKNQELPLGDPPPKDTFPADRPKGKKGK